MSACSEASNAGAEGEEAGTEAARRPLFSELDESVLRPRPISVATDPSVSSPSATSTPSTFKLGKPVLRVFENHDLGFDESDTSGPPTVVARDTTSGSGRPFAKSVTFSVDLDFCMFAPVPDGPAAAPSLPDGTPFSISETVRSFRPASAQIPPRCLCSELSKNAISSIFGRTTDSLIWHTKFARKEN